MNGDLPCPFCGSLALVCYEPRIGKWEVACEQCGACGPAAPSAPKAKAEWNTRTLIAQSPQAQYRVNPDK